MNDTERVSWSRTVIISPVVLAIIGLVLVLSTGAAVFSSVFGWPRVRISADDIKAVEVVEVNPTGDFGGWGYRRAGSGRTGVIMRVGEAIEVTRSNGKRFVVTVDDANTGAAVLAAMVAVQAR